MDDKIEIVGDPIYDDDDREEDLVIFTNEDQHYCLPTMEAQDWSEEAVQPAGDWRAVPGCCFVKYATFDEADRAEPSGLYIINILYLEEQDLFREMAAAALNALNGTFVMRGCDQSLKLDVLSENSPLPQTESILNDTVASSLTDSLDRITNIKVQNSKLIEEHSTVIGSVTNSIQSGMITSDEMDLLVEQVKMLAGEIAFSTSTLKRLEQSVDDPDGKKIQIENLECEIQEKQRQIRVLEQRIMENGEASMTNATLLDMQQTVVRLMTQCNEKGFELELKSADNRILQEQLQQKCSEIKDLEDQVFHLQQQLSSLKFEKHQELVPEEVNSLKCKLQSQVDENVKFITERLQLIEENNELLSHNKRLAEEASYAKELASAAAVELKNLAEEVTKLTLQNARQAKDLLTAQDLAYSKTANGATRRFSESKNETIKLGRRSRPASRNSGGGNTNIENWDLDLDGIRMELQVRKQREASLEAALTVKEHLEEDYKRKLDEAKKREKTLENDLANMWVLVAKLKKGAQSTNFNPDKSSTTLVDALDNIQMIDEHNGSPEYGVSPDSLVKLNNDQLNHSQEDEPMLVRLKARIQEMKEKEFDFSRSGDTNSHVCKVCFESSTSAVLLPCRHYCLCKPCSLACSECPLCRTKIVDRIITFTS
ncbi:kinesin-like protein KIN-7K, chloroplastic [Zingiber officinale]|uniref:kinesin-like protein KIN-7K, chloroplastic n=1 Tax=Zingiber officinale TaxID=94328 RepID=UPI001C4CC6DE|nr:kinesin-like protein KIN-7K, chloroplastic [Zingiber officinale]